MTTRSAPGRRAGGGYFAGVEADLSALAFLLSGIVNIALIAYAASRQQDAPPRPGQPTWESIQAEHEAFQRDLADTPWKPRAAELGLRHSYDGSHHVLEGKLRGAPLQVNVCQPPPQSLGYERPGTIRLRYSLPDLGKQTLAALWEQAGPNLKGCCKGPETDLRGRIVLSCAPSQHQTLWPELLAWLTAAHKSLHPQWYALAEREGWPLTLNHDGLPRISALHQGRAVQLSIERVQGKLRTRLMCLVDTGQPPFQLLHRERGRGASVRFAHPIADSLLWGRAEEPEAVRALLAHPLAFERLMAIVHGYPGSEVRQDRIVLVAPGDLGEGLRDALELAVDAAQALQAPA